MWVSVTGYMYYLYQLKNCDALAGPSLHFVRLIAFNGLPLQTLPMLQADQPQMTECTGAARSSVSILTRAPASLVTVQSLRETTEAALPGVFTATLKVMIDIDAQPALESISLDQVVVNLLSCFAKCYGKFW